MSDVAAKTTKALGGLTPEQVARLLATDPARIESRLSHLMGNMSLSASRALAFYTFYLRAHRARAEGQKP